MDEVAEYWMKHLPDPRDFLPESDDNTASFMRQVMYIGGPRALEWIWEPRINEAGNWPFSSHARGRMSWFFMRLMEQANIDAKQEQERLARKAIEAQDQARRQRRRAAGWA